MDTWIDRDTTYSDNAYAPIFRWRTAFQYDFQARMDWCVKPHHQANHPPVAVCSGQQTQDVVAGSVVHLSADSSSDPDGDALSYHWVCYPEAGTFQGDITIHHADSPSARFIAPPATPGTQIHIILAVTDHRCTTPDTLPEENLQHSSLTR